MEPVAVVIPTLNEVGTIGDVIREIPPTFAGDIIIADSGSTDGTQQAAMPQGTILSPWPWRRELPTNLNALSAKDRHYRRLKTVCRHGSLPPSP
jgi:hypothetical protein